MLKDLDKRQNEVQPGIASAAPAHEKKSPMKLVFLILMVVVLLNIIGIYVWQLYVENQNLREQKAKVSHSKSIENQPQQTIKKSEIELKSIKQPTKEIAPIAITKINQKTEKPPLNGMISKVEPSGDLKENKLATSEAKSASDEERIVTNGNVVTGISDDKVNANVTKKLESRIEKLNPPKLTISRKQLTPSALAEKKVREAEQAIENKEIAKAETLLEDVLLVMPEHQTARKRLAALWYGKKAYQQAVNLLSQGIAIAPESEDMRLMSARIYFERAQYRQTYDLLSTIYNSDNSELLALKATAASELNEHQNAVTTYKKLTQLEPHIGRWQLGLAVSFDTLGQFSQAASAYKLALSKNNLSNSAIAFARQRITELGE